MDTILTSAGTIAAIIAAYFAYKTYTRPNSIQKAIMKCLKKGPQTTNGLCRTISHPRTEIITQLGCLENQKKVKKRCPDLHASLDHYTWELTS